MAMRYDLSITLPTLPYPKNSTNCFPACSFNVGKAASKFADQDQVRSARSFYLNHPFFVKMSVLTEKGEDYSIDLSFVILRVK